MASCITYARLHRVKSGVGAGYGLFTSVGKWVVNSGKTRDRVQGRDSRVCKMIKMINYMFWAEQVRVDPPQGESPKCYSRLDMNPYDVSS